MWINSGDDHYSKEMPISAITAAAIAREKAAKRHEIKCLKLDSYLPEPGGNEAIINTPQTRPVARSLAECQECIVELEQLEAGARDNHVCNHRPDPVSTPERRQERQTLSVQSYKGHEEDTRQEIMTLLEEIEEKLDILSDKTFEFTNIAERPDAIAHDKHLDEWVKFVERLTTRARSFMRVLKEASQIDTVDRGIVQLDETQNVPKGQARNHGNSAVNTGEGTSQIGNNNGDAEVTWPLPSNQ